MYAKTQEIDSDGGGVRRRRPPWIRQCLRHPCCSDKQVRRQEVLLLLIINRKPSSGVMKIDPKRGDYFARRCDTLNNDQLNEL